MRNLLFHLLMENIVQLLRLRKRCEYRDETEQSATPTYGR